MRTERINLWKEAEYAYSPSFGFMPNLVTYLHDEDTSLRPCIIVAPGGGYRIVSPTEAMIVAMAFYEKGYNTFVLTYTTNLLSLAPVRLQALRDISRAVRLVRAGAASLCCDPARLAVLGFSAAGHLCASLAVHYRDVADPDETYRSISNRPDAAILCYPVITSGEKAHRDSFTALLGPDPKPEDLEYMSLEKHVTPDTPPCFLWQTAEDELVPVENSCLFAMACLRAGVPFAHHVFTKGHHGLSLSNDTWARGDFGEPYTFEQIACMSRAVKAGELTVSDEARESLRTFVPDTDVPDTGSPAAPQPETPPKAVAVWPDLTDAWLREQWG